MRRKLQKELQNRMEEAKMIINSLRLFVSFFSFYISYRLVLADLGQSHGVQVALMWL